MTRTLLGPLVVLAGVLLVPSMAAGQDEAATGPGSGPDPVVDPILHGPFQWHEAFRVDLRPRSPMTPRTLRIQPAAPLFGSPSRNFILIGEYRYDDLEPQPELDGGPLHRGELGGIYNRRLAPDLALNVDARVVYAVDADGHHPSAWYPNLRAGVTWSPSPEVAVSGAIFWSRTMLGLIPVPLLGVYYLAPDERFRVDVLAPRYVEAGFRPLPTFEVFAVGHWETLVWSVRDRASNEGRDFLVRQEVRAQAGLRVFLFGPVGLEVSAQWIPFQVAALGDVRERPASLDDVALTVGVVIDKVALRRTGFGAPAPVNRLPGNPGRGSSLRR